MNKIEFDDFLERGWEYGADLFFENKIFHVQCDFDSKTEKLNLLVFSFKAMKESSCYFATYVDAERNYCDYEILINEHFDCKEKAKERFLSSKIFNGSTFWEINDSIEWLDDGGNELII